VFPSKKHFEKQLLLLYQTHPILKGPKGVQLVLICFCIMYNDTFMYIKIISTFVFIYFESIFEKIYKINYYYYWYFYIVLMCYEKNKL